VNEVERLELHDVRGVLLQVQSPDALIRGAQVHARARLVVRLQVPGRAGCTGVRPVFEIAARGEDPARVGVGHVGVQIIRAGGAAGGSHPRCDPIRLCRGRGGGLDTAQARHLQVSAAPRAEGAARRCESRVGERARARDVEVEAAGLGRGSTAGDVVPLLDAEAPGGRRRNRVRGLDRVRVGPGPLHQRLTAARLRPDRTGRVEHGEAVVDPAVDARLGEDRPAVRVDVVLRPRRAVLTEPRETERRRVRARRHGRKRDQRRQNRQK
jgi:hypothetical protein